MTYENMDVYKLAFRLALEVHMQSLKWPKMEQYGGIADQIRRSSKGICANIAEGVSKHMSIADRRRFLQMALGSVEETRVWVAFAWELNYMSDDESLRLREEYQRVAQMLFQLQKKLKF